MKQLGQAKASMYTMQLTIKDRVGNSGRIMLDNLLLNGQRTSFHQENSDETFARGKQELGSMNTENMRAL